MIEVLAQSGGDLFPSGRGVARLAGLLEATVVDISVAVIALAKRKARVSRLAVGTGRMAFFALYFQVKSGQWIARLRVVEFLID